MRLKEASLWLLFLAVCFASGFVKGYLPPDTWPSFAGGPREVEILVHDPQLFPNDLKDTLEKRLNIKIDLTTVQDREEFAIRTITSPGYHLALVPDHWIRPAVIANQMSNLNPVRDLRRNVVAVDFLKDRDAERVYNFPVYWQMTSLKKTPSTSPNKPEKPEKHPKQEKTDKIEKYFFLKDWDFIAFKLRELDVPTNFVTPWSFWTPIPTDGMEKAVVEVSHLDEPSIPKDWSSFDPPLRSLYIWSYCTPRHSPSRKMTLRLIRELADPQLQLGIVQKINLATTFKALDGASILQTKKAAHIRDMDLSNLKQPQWLGLEQIQEIKLKF